MHLNLSLGALIGAPPLEMASKIAYSGNMSLTMKEIDFFFCFDVYEVIDKYIFESTRAEVKKWTCQSIRSYLIDLGNGNESQVDSFYNVVENLYEKFGSATESRPPLIELLLRCIYQGGIGLFMPNMKPHIGEMIYETGKKVPIFGQDMFLFQMEIAMTGQYEPLSPYPPTVIDGW
ncbi:hypothetical protein DM02DRAFT_632262 [Periconia macrospinosa]|uniref:Uncharacterized protein n=1 Tax=Periconia macrospinosa TaxID=97972 RepID=A0A2V1DDM5_9PLEO|nr:hypothetical protein DM02DRAFT_632262 [Periconia macrospinosa]